VVEGVGRRVPPFDVDALARAIGEVAGDPVEREALGRAARAHALEHYAEEPALDRFEAYFRRVIARGVAGVSR
jgi:glycosyltransferase involved in cell wall biosynthesis